MKKITRESLKKAEKGSGVYTMGSVYKLPDTWTLKCYTNVVTVVANKI